MSMWKRGTFEIAVGTVGDGRDDQVQTGTETVTGETWSSFGIHGNRGRWGTDWIVTHLPTGYRMVALATKTRARQFCAEIAPLTDWATTDRCPPEIRDDVLAAYYRAIGVRLTVSSTASTPREEAVS